MASPTPFLDEARQLADDDHYTLGLELEAMRMSQSYTRHDIAGWKGDYGWRDDAADYFDAHRDFYLEKAREFYAECAA